MDSFEYAMGLISIVVGLALADIGNSVHKLIRNRRSLIFDARPFLAAIFTFLLLFSMWFETWNIHGRPEILTYPFLLSLVVELLFLFLMATMVLPDDPVPNASMAHFYDDNARPIWTLFLLFRLSYFGHWLYFSITSSRFDLNRFLVDLVVEFVILAVAAALIAMPRRRGLHLVLVPLLIGYWLVQYWGSRIAL